MDYSLIKSYTKEATLALIGEKLNIMDILLLIGDKIQKNELLKLLSKYYDKNEIKTVLLKACQGIDEDETKNMQNKVEDIQKKKIKSNKQKKIIKEEYEYDKNYKEDPYDEDGICKYCEWGPHLSDSHMLKSLDKGCKYIQKTYTKEELNAHFNIYEEEEEEEEEDD